MTYSVIAVRAAILTVAQTALPEPVLVERGQLGTYVPADRFVLGSSAAGAPGSEGTFTPANIGQPDTRWDELYDIAGQITAWAGDKDETTRETRAWEMFESFAAGLHADQSLGGLVLRAYVASWDLTSGPTQDPRGTAAQVTFTVRVANQTF